MKNSPSYKKANFISILRDFLTAKSHRLTGDDELCIRSGYRRGGIFRFREEQEFFSVGNQERPSRGRRICQVLKAVRAWTFSECASGSRWGQWEAFEVYEPHKARAWKQEIFGFYVREQNAFILLGERGSSDFPGICFESYSEQEPRVQSGPYTESQDSTKCIFEDVSCVLRFNGKKAGCVSITKGLMYS